MTLAIAFALSACLAVPPASDRILARDIAAAFPPAASLPPNTEIAFAPAPGVTRVFRALDLRMLSARFHLDAADTTEFCVARKVAPLEVADLVAAMKKSLPDARIEVVDFSRQPAPEGEIEFPIAGLHPTPGRSDGLWYGSVRYGGTRRFAVWAKVRVQVPATRVFAAADLKPGQPIEAAQVSAETRDEFPTAGQYAEGIEQVAGRWPRVPIRAGASIRLDQLEQPKAVMRGETVTVEVRNGAAMLKLEGVAEAAGAVGDSIPVVNPSSKKRFHARVDGKGRVSVDAAAAGNGEKQP